MIGGAQIFGEVIDRADRLEVTQIAADIEGDTVAPPLTERWAVAWSDPATGWHTSRAGLAVPVPPLRAPLASIGWTRC